MQGAHAVTAAPVVPPIVPLPVPSPAPHHAALLLQRVPGADVVQAERRAAAEQVRVRQARQPALPHLAGHEALHGAIGRLGEEGKGAAGHVDIAAARPKVKLQRMMKRGGTIRGCVGRRQQELLPLAR